MASGMRKEVVGKTRDMAKAASVPAMQPCFAVPVRFGGSGRAATETGVDTLGRQCYSETKVTRSMR